MNGIRLFALSACLTSPCFAYVVEDEITGTVRDSKGPMEKLLVLERDSLNRVVSYAFTDAKGCFSFQPMFRNETIQIRRVGYEPVDMPVDTDRFDIRMTEYEELGYLPEVDVSAGRIYYDFPFDSCATIVTPGDTLQLDIPGLEIRTDANGLRHITSLSEPDTSGNHEYVDLGLSVKWATCNIGADRPELNGERFGNYEDENGSHHEKYFRFHLGGTVPYGKYNPRDMVERLFAPTELLIEDDIANVLWGGRWRLPTKREFGELTENCIFVWAYMNNRPGYLVVSRKKGYTDRYIFLPVIWEKDNERYACSYWSGSFSDSRVNMSALNLSFGYYNYGFPDASLRAGVAIDGGGWNNGVRPVCP